MRRSATLPALALLLAAWAAPAALHADEAADATARALEGRLAEARQALAGWREPTPLGRLDTSGFEILVWRATWTVDAQGRVAPFEDDTLAEVRRVAHRPAAPEAAPQAAGPFQVVEALYRERLQREVRGMGDLPTASPLASVPDPSGAIARFLAWQRHVYQPVPPEQSPDAAWAAQAKAAREKAESHRAAAHLTALLAAGLLLALTLLLGWRLGRAPRS